MLHEEGMTYSLMHPKENTGGINSQCTRGPCDVIPMEPFGFGAILRDRLFFFLGDQKC